MNILSSLDKNQPIYISEKGREDLFNYILLQEKSDTLQRVWEDIEGLYEYMFSAENLERYCLGATNRADYAYKKISKLLRKEYEEWKINQCPKQVFKDMHGVELHIGDKVRYYTYPNYDKYFSAVIEKFATTTVRVLLNGKIPKYTQSKYLEIISDSTIETLKITRKDVKYLKTLLDKSKHIPKEFSELAQYINKILEE